MTPGTRRPTSVLEEERDFLLRSLRDLEAEHDAGDIDDTDYATLKDDYTARAAAVLRELAGGPDDAGSTGEDGGAPAADPPDGVDGTSGAPGEDAGTGAARDAAAGEAAGGDAPVGRRGRRGVRRWAAVAAVGLAFGGLAGWAVVAASGHRSPGQVVSGDAVGPEKVTLLLAKAQQEAAAGKGVAALKDCQTVLAMDPGQPQALAEEGWLLAQTQRSDLQTEGVDDLNQALATDPQDGTAHLYRGIVLLDLGRSAQAVPDLQWYLAHDPAPQIKAKVEQELAQAQAAAPAP
jgi:hypothetical protein